MFLLSAGVADDPRLFKKRNHLRARRRHRTVGCRHPQFCGVRSFKTRVRPPRPLGTNLGRGIEKHFKELVKRRAQVLPITLVQSADRNYDRHVVGQQSFAKPSQRFISGRKVTILGFVVNENRRDTAGIEIGRHRSTHGAFARSGLAGEPKTSTGSHGSTLRRLSPDRGSSGRGEKWDT